MNKQILNEINAHHEVIRLKFHVKVALVASKIYYILLTSEKVAVHKSKLLSLLI